MRAGYAAVPLPVPVGSDLGGYADRAGGATGTLDELSVAAVSIACGPDRLVWIVADLPCVNTDLAVAIRAAVPGGNVWVSATHTHSGPETGCAPGGAPTPAPWLDAVTHAAARAADEAVRAETPVALRHHRVELSDVGGQRSGERPALTVPVDVLSFGDAGLVVVLPVHPTVLSADNRMVSADLTGAVRRALAATGRWVVVATGAAGDVSTRPHRRAQTAQECDRLGALVAQAVLDGLSTPGVEASGPMSVRGTTVALRPKASAAPVFDRLRGNVRAAEAGGDPVAIRTAQTALQAAVLAERETVPADLSCEVATATFGPLTLGAVGAEPYLALADRLDAAVGRPSVLIGYTNGYLGYLPTLEACDRPDYEVIRSPVAPGSAEIVLAEVAALASR